MEKEALYKLTYGLYLLSAQAWGKDNACIINTAAQVANDPDRVAISVIKGNLTCDMVRESGRFALSALTTGTDFSLFQRFGMQSGRDADKFAGFDGARRGEDGLYHLEGAAMYLSAKVVNSLDLGSHVLYVGRLEEARVLGGGEPCTYAYYQSHIKPKPQSGGAKKQWVCSVCGYVYEGDEVPDDYLCPLCKHGKEFFELR